jgi:hypothetical protein
MTNIERLCCFGDFGNNEVVKLVGYLGKLSANLLQVWIIVCWLIYTNSFR